MRALKAKLMRKLVRQVIKLSGEPLPYRDLHRGHTGEIVNSPKSHRGLYRHIKKGLIKIDPPAEQP